jgi:hypothetical protein
MISDIVYDQKQFDNAESLWTAIEKAVEEINTSKKAKIKGIYDGFNSRLLKVIDAKGEAIPY